MFYFLTLTRGLTYLYFSEFPKKRDSEVNMETPILGQWVEG